MDGSRGGPKHIDWELVREAYRAGMTVAQLAKRFDVSTRMIRARKESDARNGEIWSVDDRDVDGDAADRGNLITFPGHKRALGERDESDVGGTVEYALTLQGAIAVKWMLTAGKLLDDLAAGRIRPGTNQSIADVADRIGSFAAKAFDTTRDAAGRRPGDASHREIGDGNRLIIEHVTLLPMKLPIDSKGRAIGE